MQFNPRLKFYIRLDGKGRKISGSGIWRLRKPKIGFWVEEELSICCTTTTTSSTTTTTTSA